MSQDAWYHIVGVFDVLAGHIGNTFCLRFSLQFSIYPIGVK